jgi:hypothetical protein
MRRHFILAAFCFSIVAALVIGRASAQIVQNTDAGVILVSRLWSLALLATIALAVVSVTLGAFSRACAQTVAQPAAAAATPAVPSTGSTAPAAVPVTAIATATAATPTTPPSVTWGSPTFYHGLSLPLLVLPGQHPSRFGASERRLRRGSVRGRLQVERSQSLGSLPRARRLPLG